MLLQFPRVIRAAAGVLLLLTLTLLPANVAQAGVIQEVKIVVADQSDSALVFGVTGADITTDIFASVINLSSPIGSPNGQGRGSIGRFGNLGVSFEATGVAEPANAPDNTLSARVLIGSDEFVNHTGATQSVRATAIIDGGLLHLVAANMELSYELSVGIFDLEMEPISTSEISTLVDAGIAAGFGVHAGGSLIGDASFATTFTSFGGGLDATFNPTTGMLDIPVSVQSFDLGTIEPGHRFAVGYEFKMQLRPRTGNQGILEIARAQYSDPLNVPNYPAFTVSFTPTTAIPEPSSLVLLSIGGLALLGYGRTRRTRRTKHHKPAA